MFAGEVLMCLIMGVVLIASGTFFLSIKEEEDNIIPIVLVFILGFLIFWLGSRQNGINMAKHNMRHDFKIDTNKPYKTEITETNGKKDTIYYFKNAKIDTSYLID